MSSLDDLGKKPQPVVPKKKRVTATDFLDMIKSVKNKKKKK